MPEPAWQLPKEFEVPACSKFGFWTRILDYVEAGSSLKFVVDDKTFPVPQGGMVAPPRPPRWSYAPQLTCTADGDPTAPFNQTSCLEPRAAPGALIAKVGGSTGGRGDDGKTFVIGSFCTLLLDSSTRGTLFLSMNFDPARPSERSGSIEVKVFVGA